MSVVNVNTTDDEEARLIEDDTEVLDEEGLRQDKDGPQTPSTANYEEALLATGFGWFNIVLLLVCGWAQISDSIEILSVSFLLPVIKFDGEPLDSFNKGLLNSVIFAGMLVGGYGWGSLSDIRGRKQIIVISLVMNAVFGFISSLVDSYWVFLSCRFMSGVGVGGTVPVIFSYFGELQQSRYRGTMISCLSTCWMMGNILTAALAWWIIPSEIPYLHPEDSWRAFIALCTFPAMSSAAIVSYLPESPKFLLESGQEKAALVIMEKIFRRNRKHRNRLREYPVKHLIASDKTHRAGRHGRSTFLQVIHGTAELFRPPVLRSTVAMLVIVFSLSFGYYGLWMWFPQIFAQVEYGNGTACSSSHVPVKPPKGEAAIYQDAFLTSLSNLPGNLITIIFMDKLGRRFLMALSLILSGVGAFFITSVSLLSLFPALSLILSGVSAFFIWFVSTRTQVLITSLVFGGVSVIAWNTINVLGVEIFPTRMRSTSSGVRSILNRVGAILGNLLFGVLITVHCSVPLLTVAVLFAIAGLTTFTLPDTTKVALK